jgi:hypothetical protein
MDVLRKGLLSSGGLLLSKGTLVSSPLLLRTMGSGSSVSDGSTPSTLSYRKSITASTQAANTETMQRAALSQRAAGKPYFSATFGSTAKFTALPTRANESLSTRAKQNQLGE